MNTTSIPDESYVQCPICGGLVRGLLHDQYGNRMCKSCWREIHPAPYYEHPETRWEQPWQTQTYPACDGMGSGT